MRVSSAEDSRGWWRCHILMSRQGCGMRISIWEVDVDYCFFIVTDQLSFKDSLSLGLNRRKKTTVGCYARDNNGKVLEFYDRRFGLMHRGYLTKGMKFTCRVPLAVLRSSFCILFFYVCDYAASIWMGGWGCSSYDFSHGRVVFSYDLLWIANAIITGFRGWWSVSRENI